MDRTGLYIMVFIILINTCSSYSITLQIRNDVDDLRKTVEGIKK